MPRFVLIRFLRAEDGTALHVGQVVRVEDATADNGLPVKRYGQCDIVARINGVDRRRANVSTSCYVELREES